MDRHSPSKRDHAGSSPAWDVKALMVKLDSYYPPKVEFQVRVLVGALFCPCSSVELEHYATNVGVGGSSPSRDVIICECSKAGDQVSKARWESSILSAYVYRCVA